MNEPRCYINRSDNPVRVRGEYGPRFTAIFTPLDCVNHPRIRSQLFFNGKAEISISYEGKRRGIIDGRVGFRRRRDRDAA